MRRGGAEAWCDQASAIIRAWVALLHIVSVALITAGLVILADVATTLAWREPVSSVYGSIQQHQAASQLADLERTFPSPADLRRADRANGNRRRVGLLADLFAKRVHTGEAIGRITIPSIGLNVVAVQGTDTASLQKGPGHYPDTPFPGQRGTTAFAGHRTTYLAPFRHLDAPRRRRPHPGRDALRDLLLPGPDDPGRLAFGPRDSAPGRL